MDIFYNKYIKYKNKYINLKFNNYNRQLGGDIVLFEDINHTNRELIRSEFMKKYFPFYNQETSGINLIFKDQYIIYNNENTKTYVLDDELKCNAVKSASQRTPEIFDKKKIIELINDNLMNIININNTLKIPFIFFKMNYINIFNIFIASIDFTDSNDYDQLSDFFRYHKDIHNFIMMSITFNIFNVTLFFNNFFNLVELIIKSVNDEYNIMSGSDLITLIFAPSGMQTNTNTNTNYKTALKNLFDSFKYINLLIKKKLLENKYNNKLSSGIETTIVLKYEKHIFNKTSLDDNYDEIINILYEQFLFIIKILNKIKIDLKWEDFPLLFLMSIIQYRIYQQYLANTWSFSYKFIYDFLTKNTYIPLNDIYNNINTHIQLFYDDNTQSIDLKDKSLAILYKPIYPILYKMSYTDYNEIIFSNCMETIILQFLKILFYDYNDIDPYKYNFIKIKELIKEDYCKQIIFFLEDIINEETYTYKTNWANFLYNLDIDKTCQYYYESRHVCLHGSYKNFEKIYNIIFIKDISFINEIIKSINNKYIIEININSTDETTEYKITTNIIRIILFHSDHASLTEYNNNYILNYNVNYDNYKYIYYFNLMYYILIKDHFLRKNKILIIQLIKIDYIQLLIFNAFANIIINIKEINDSSYYLDLLETFEYTKLDLYKSINVYKHLLLYCDDNFIENIEKYNNIINIITTNINLNIIYNIRLGLLSKKHYIYHNIVFDFLNIDECNKLIDLIKDNDKFNKYKSNLSETLDIKRTRRALYIS